VAVAMHPIRATVALIVTGGAPTEIEIATETFEIVTGTETEEEIATETAVDKSRIVTEIDIGVIETATATGTGGTETEEEIATTVETVIDEEATRKRASQSTISMISSRWARSTTRLSHRFSAVSARCTSTRSEPRTANLQLYFVIKKEA